MKLSEFAKKIIKDFLLIFALIIIIITILRQLYFPDEAFDLKSIYIIMAFAFLSAIIGFILYSPNDLSEKNMRIRMILHFFTLEILLIALSSVFGIVESPSDGIILAVQIAIIYFIVRFLSWKKDQKEAQQINEKLMAWKKDVP
jgi:energy-coupling factor transporter transmembrane protein EcfT